MAAAAILEKFQMAISPQPVVYLHNGKRSTYIARIRAVISAIAQLSCVIENCTKTLSIDTKIDDP